jgi:hypothetical protein
MLKFFKTIFSETNFFPRKTENLLKYAKIHVYIYIYIYIYKHVESSNKSLFNIEMFTLWRPITGSVHYFIFRGQDGGIINTGRWMWLTLIESGIRHQCWWRCSPKPGQNEPSTTPTHINIHQNSVSDSVVNEPQLKIPKRVHQLQTTKQVSNGWGRKWTPTNKELRISFSLFWGLFQSKIWRKGFSLPGRSSANSSEYLT